MRPFDDDDYFDEMYDQAYTCPFCGFTFCRCHDDQLIDDDDDKWDDYDDYWYDDDEDADEMSEDSRNQGDGHY